ncbi:MAG TPA: pantetheine-phosphate adenylyltransferase [Planctomycetota bacterium]|jgi:pantetheine-phosphate adenylyltransferase|nr:pantetheine-phosphate adenylyltransferase [Planctomycetota bacterium]
MSVAVYPGSFDPITNGHLDVIRRGAKIFDRLIVAVADNPAKQALFTKDERVEMIREVTRGFRNVEVDSFDGLVVDYVRRRKAHVILRGIRTISDFEYEYQMALTNRTFAPDIETTFLLTHEEYSFMSSRLIKEAASLGGDVSAFLPKEVEKRLRAKLRKP